MPEVTLRHEFECDESVYWEETTFNPSYVERLYRDVLGFERCEFLELSEGKSTRTRRLRVDPPLRRLPKAVRNAVGEAFSYVEHGTFDKRTRTYTFTIEPSTMGHVTRAFGEVHCEALGPSRLAQIARVTVEVRLFLVGHLVEERLLRDVRQSYEAAARFTREVLAEAST